jgi:hypothetical protein
MAKKPPRITSQSMARGFQRGRRVVAPKRETRNPYPPGSNKAFDWISGFIEGRQKPLLRKP